MTDSPFSKKLASDDLDVRNQGFDQLQAFLTAKTQVERLDMDRLWKIIHYGLYMSDGMAQQQSYCCKAAKLMEGFSDPYQFYQWCSSFWMTWNREFLQIDKHRLNKYLLCIRIFTAECFATLRRHQWEDAWLTVFEKSLTTEGPLQEGTNLVPGVTCQFAYCFWEELLPEVEGHPQKEALCLRVLTLFFNFMKRCPYHTCTKRIQTNVFQAAPDFLSEPIKSLCLEYGKDKKTLQENREIFYEVAQQV